MQMTTLGTSNSGSNLLEYLLDDVALWQSGQIVEKLMCQAANHFRPRRAIDHEGKEKHLDNDSVTVHLKFFCGICFMQNSY